MYVLVEIDRPTTKPLHPEKVVVEQAGLKLVDESVTRRYVGATGPGPGPVQIFDVCRLIFFLGRSEKVRSATLGLCCSKGALCEKSSIEVLSKILIRRKSSARMSFGKDDRNRTVISVPGLYTSSQVGVCTVPHMYNTSTYKG